MSLSVTSSPDFYSIDNTVYRGGVPFLPIALMMAPIVSTAVMAPVFPPVSRDSGVIFVTVGIAISIVRRPCIPAVSMGAVRVTRVFIRATTVAAAVIRGVGLVSLAAIAVATVRVALVSMAAIAVAAPIVGIICKGWDSKEDESRREDYS